MTRHSWAKVRMFLPILAALLLVIGVACGAAATATPRPATPAKITLAPTSTTGPGATTGTEATVAIRPANTPVPTPTSVPVAVPVGQAKYGGTINMAAYADTKNWDPLGSASISSLQALSQLYNQVVQFDTVDTTKKVGDLAKSWDITNGGRTFTFSLKENIKWQDGQDLTAEDVVYSMSRYMNPENSMGRSGLFRNYTLPVEEGGVKLIDRNTVEFNLQFPTDAFIKFLAIDYVKVLPKHLLEQGIDLDQAENIIKYKSGSGPFVLEDYKRGSFYKVSKNRNYFKEGRPFFDAIDHFIITDTGRLSAAFESGQVDMMNSGFSNLTTTEYLQLEKATGGDVIVYPLGASLNVGLMINVKKEPFKDPRVRKAIYLAIDRQQINELVLDGTGAITPIFMPGMAYTEQDAITWPGIRPKAANLDEDPDIIEARRLMAEAGFPDGFSTTYDARQVGTYVNVCQVVKRQLKEALGIDGEIRTHESAAGYALYQTARAPGSEGGWELACQGEAVTVLDPDSIFGGVYRSGGTRNYTDWSHPIVDDLFEQQKVEQDPLKRLELVRQTADFLRSFEDNHWVTLHWAKFFWPVHEDIKGFHPQQSNQTGLKHEDLWLDR